MNRSLVTRLPRLAAVFASEAQAEAALDRFGSAMMPRSENATLETAYSSMYSGWLVCVILRGSNMGRTYWLSDAAVAAVTELERPGGCGAAVNPLERIILDAQADADRNNVTLTVWNLNRFSALYVIRTYRDGDESRDQFVAKVEPAVNDLTIKDAQTIMVEEEEREELIRQLERPGGCGAARNPLLELAKEASEAIGKLALAFHDGDLREAYTPEGERACERLWTAGDRLAAAIEELERSGGCGAMRFPKFFSIDDGKAVKAQKNAKGWLNAINYMAPHASAGVGNLCPHASAGCRALCLGTESGQAAMRKADEDNSVTRSRKAKAVYYMRERRAFLAELVHHISRALARADAEKRRLCVRLNGATDIAWESAAVGGVRIMDIFHDVQFVDYTKSVKRMLAFCDGRLQANYHLTFSRSEDNEAECEQVLRAGGNVAVVFASVPITWKGWPVVDGDKHDLRHLDSTPVSWSGGAVIGLLPKGNKAKRDQSGFVVR